MNLFLVSFQLVMLLIINAGLINFLRRNIWQYIYIIICQSVSVRLSVFSTFWPTFHQSISNPSTDLGSLGQGKGYLLSARTRKVFFHGPFFPMYLTKYISCISCPFVCSINFLTPSPLSYFKFKHNVDFFGQSRVNKTIC